MTWVQVECSSGSRYAAPSHGRPLPNFSGAARLFQPPLGLRKLQTFDLMKLNGSVDLESDCNDGINATVLVDQRDLGRHLGITTVIVGCEEEVAEDEIIDASPPSAHARRASGGLQRLMERVFGILVNTNDHGIATLLDALCTRSPFLLTTEAASRASTVLEDDGGPLVSPALQQERAQLPKGEAGINDNGKASNHRFLQHLTQGGVAASSHQEKTSSLQLLPSSSLAVALKSQKEVARNKETRTAAPSQPLSFAAAMRRQSLLFFVEHNVVPLSMLSSHVQVVEPVEQQREPAASPSVQNGMPGYVNVAGRIDTSATPNTSSAVPADRFLNSLAQRVCSAPPKHSSTLTNSQLICTSPLRRRPGKALEKNAAWTAVAQTAEESGQLLLLLFWRLFVNQPLGPTDAVQMERILFKEMWDAEAPSGLSSSLVPMMAAYSPSGLLIASASFRRSLGHEEFMLLSAAAVDCLARFTRPSPPSSRAANGKGPARYADVFRWTSWPMRLGERTLRAQELISEAQIVDVLLLTIGDALAVCMCFPRVSRSDAAEVSPAVAAALSLDGVQQLLERTVASVSDSDSTSRQGSPLLLPLLSTSLMDSLVYACTHSTMPFNPVFHDALFVATAVEEALGSMHLDNGLLSSSLLYAANTEVREVVADELRRLLQGQTGQPIMSAPHRFSSAQQLQRHTWPSNPPEAALNSAVVHPVTAVDTKSRSVLHTLFACLPLQNRRSSRRRAAQPSANRDYMAESRKQTEAHIRRLEGLNAQAPSTHAPFIGCQQSSVSRSSAILALPLDCMMCYVAALVTRNELGALRRVHELGLHSFFYLQQNVVPCLKGKSAKASPSGLCGVRAAPGNGVGGDSRRGKATPSSSCHDSPRFGISFARLCLQQPQCPSAILPDEWANVEGMQDGQGGELAFIEDPTLTLRLSIQTPSTGERSAHAHKALVPAVVTVLPCWSILHVTPMEPLVESSHSSGDAKGGDADSLDDSLSSVADTDGVLGSCPASLHDDAQLLTSFSFVLRQKLHRRTTSMHPSAATATMGGGGGGRAGAPASNPSLPPPQSAPSTLTPPASTSLAPTWMLPESEGKHRVSGTAWADVSVVISICGDIEDEGASALLRALQQHSLSKAKKATADATVSGGWAAVSADGDPVECEYAAGAAPHMRELIREVLLCQEVALLLLEAASCGL
ncbi:hypothetical protein ABL78_7276 [Leptomonas seymouri]|uniref:Uncharacterized protein n=1 Tax=Leptomonas seymouri TaxID=5684 RepID=A0A0N1IHC8_LEPSE|nr:hypothetical protein ABL78_7276 [Leptomonas seymouri]|eukprot:KPI83682.1 hypothetical protein ABL78_7276 [Leptomonas seymouri]